MGKSDDDMLSHPYAVRVAIPVAQAGIDAAKTA